MVRQETESYPYEFNRGYPCRIYAMWVATQKLMVFEGEEGHHCIDCENAKMVEGTQLVVIPKAEERRKLR